LIPAKNQFKAQDYISPVFILLPQIEGLVTAHIKRKGMMPKRSLDKRFKQFGDIIKAEKFNTWMTCYLTDKLISYLKNAFYKTWFPYHAKQIPNIGPQRHVLLHGEFHLKYFNAESCLKLICVIDAIILLSIKRSELSIGRGLT